MSQDAALRFSVEESVWFQKGQEVFELLSISLDPNIAIEEHDQYVSIRGALCLTGEYNPVLNPENEEKEFEFSAARYVNEVNVREDGTHELIHRFPVDITIPKNRIDKLEEVYVSIDSFDYDLPESTCLKLYADLSITGIGENSREQEEEQEIQEIEDIQEETSEAVYQGEADYTEEVRTEEEKEEAFQELYAFRGETQALIEEETDEVYPEIEVEVRKQSSDYQEIEPLYQAVKEEPSPAKQDARDKQDTAAGQSENSLLLTKLFGREEEEELTRLKICIVQQGETIDSICDRYALSAQQLIRVNHLAADKEVYEGQTLYIPQYAGSK
ncbi:stage VI sporulation protein D [Bacillus sp. FJAT-42376]|uniref:stage VI sporulation protein D n=1 Tax=Bacillus sp. FJAT-42376 TaxID=2014076 RepID=UPI000F509706|nr:stage VI sporulation protein D [Bacillus sp. FJAT-42376]AZB43826.1 stage VI sporulation protein D [Bacillus sp. FJAT-42376]